MGNLGGVYTWSQTATNNATADSTINWSPQMAPSAVGPSGRALMASVAKYRDDTAGLIATGGTSTAYTVSSYQQFDTLADMHGQEVWFTPHVTNGSGGVQLNVDSLGQKPLRTAPNTELLAGVLVQGTPYGAIYNNTDGAWYLKGVFGNPYNIPLAGGMDFWGTTVPNSMFAFPAGQAISRVTYAALFAIMGTTYGVGDGSTTFNLPDKTGRVSAMKEAVATRLTSSWFGSNSANMGAVGGQESSALSNINQIPQFTPAGTISFSNASGTGSNVAATTNVNAVPSTGNAFPAVTGTMNATFTGTPVGSASPASFRTCQPTIVCNYIIRIL